MDVRWLNHYSTTHVDCHKNAFIEIRATQSALLASEIWLISSNNYYYSTV
jgi:hypothetical protein